MKTGGKVHLNSYYFKSQEKVFGFNAYKYVLVFTFRSKLKTLFYCYLSLFKGDILAGQ